jgi:hypothetical protein
MLHSYSIDLGLIGLKNVNEETAALLRVYQSKRRSSYDKRSFGVFFVQTSAVTVGRPLRSNAQRLGGAPGRRVTTTLAPSRANRAGAAVPLAASNDRTLKQT